MPSPNIDDVLPETYHFDNNGDTRLLVTGPSGLHVFIVSSKTMTLVCDAWRSMLSRDGGFKEAQPGADNMKEVSFPEDDAVALSILLSIAHLDFGGVPATVSLSTLWNLTVLTDKYGATKLVQPWVKNWIKGVKDTVSLETSKRWIWIAWEFGEEKVFETVADLLTKEAIYEGGAFHSTVGTVLDPENEDHLPPGIIESIADICSKSINSMIFVCHHYVTEYQSAHILRNTVCTNPTDARRCDALVYGSLRLALVDYNCDVIQVEDSFAWSVKDLGAKLLSIEIMTPPATASHPTISHDECNIQGELRSAIWSILNRRSAVVLEQHYEHLRRQRDILAARTPQLMDLSP